MTEDLLEMMVCTHCGLPFRGFCLRVCDACIDKYDAGSEPWAVFIKKVKEDAEENKNKN